MDSIVAWLNDPTVQGLVLSPLIGAVLGVLFAGISNPPPQGAPPSVHQTVVIFKTTVIVNSGRVQSRNSGDAAGLFFAAFLLIAGITWGYSRYADQVLSYWTSGLYSCVAFIFSAGLASALRGQYSRLEWVWYIFAPVVAIGICYYLVGLAHVGIIAGSKQVALSRSFVDFYMHSLHPEQRNWILFQILGVLLGVVATVTATLRSVYYLALMNQRSSGGASGLWRFIARHTEFSSQGFGLVLLMLVLATSYALLSGYIYSWCPEP